MNGHWSSALQARIGNRRLTLTLCGCSLEPEVVRQSLRAGLHWSPPVQCVHAVQQNSTWAIFYGLLFVVCRRRFGHADVHTDSFQIGSHPYNTAR
jgi:hypothetical protein